MKTDREDFLKQLESVLPGLSPREIIEQSSCFIFQNKTVITYNDEIACSQKCSISFNGAVQAIPLISILRKLKEKRIEITSEEEELLIKGKNRRAGIRMEKEILLPIDSLETPHKWRSLPDEFADAISLVQQCAGRDETKFTTTCINIHPKWVEATDNYQAARYKIKTDIEEATLIRKESLKHIVSLNMTKFSETKNWMHFKNPDGLILSCRRFVDEFPDVASVLKSEGTPTVLPKGLKEAAEKASIFSSENPEDNQVIINLQKGKLKITGKGASGWYSEIKKIKYKGQSLSFTIFPELLIELIQRHNKCQISQDRLKVTIGKFTYVTVLGAIEE